MSSKGIFSALSGAMAQNTRLETIANNIANSSTPGFKRDQQVFQEYLTANEKPPEVIQVPKTLATIETFYNMQGADQSFVDHAGTYTDFTQGALKATGNTLDFAIEGEGFFEVATPHGVQLTRNGTFTMDGNGHLVTSQGYPVLAQGNPGLNPEQRMIRFEPGAMITVSESGSVMQNNQTVAVLSVVEVNDKDSLRKVGNSMFHFDEGVDGLVAMSNLASPKVRQGFVEGSNVNIVSEMTDMITATRTFESAQKAIKAHDSIDEKLVNVVPRTS